MFVPKFSSLTHSLDRRTGGGRDGEWEAENNSNNNNEYTLITEHVWPKAEWILFDC